MRATRPHVFIYTAEKTLKPSDTIDAVYSITTSKALNEPVGRFEINLFPQNINQKYSFGLNNVEYWYSAICPNDIVTIGYQKPHGKMVGLVDQVFKNISLSNALGQYVLTIRGRDMGKLLVDDTVVYSPITIADGSEYKRQIAKLWNETHSLIRTTELFGPTQKETNEISFKHASLKECIKFIMSYYCSSMHVRFQRGKEVFGGDLLRNDDFINTRPEDIVYVDIPRSFQGSIFDLIKRMIDPLFYECFVESGLPDSANFPSPVALLRIRPKPFDEKSLDFVDFNLNEDFLWENSRTYIDDKPYHEIEEIIGGGIGVNDFETATFHNLTSQYELLPSPYPEFIGHNLPILDLYQAYFHGIRPLYYTASGMVTDVRKINDSEWIETGVTEIIAQKRNRLFNWFRCNKIFESGSVRVWGDDKYRVGDRVMLKGFKSKLTKSVDERKGQKDLVFYTTHVHDSWTVGEDVVTTLTLTRGHNNFAINKFKKEAEAFAKEKDLDKSFTGIKMYPNFSIKDFYIV